MNTENASGSIHTSTLLRVLFRTSHFDRFIEKQGPALQVRPFHEYVGELCEKAGLLRVDVIRRAGIERSYGFQMFQGTKKPSRDKVIQLAIGFGLDYDGAQEMLKHARHSALYPKFKRDAAIIYCLNKHLSFMDAQELLSGIGTAVLGKEPTA